MTEVRKVETEFALSDHKGLKVKVRIKNTGSKFIALLPNKKLVEQVTKECLKKRMGQW